MWKNVRINNDDDHIKKNTNYDYLLIIITKYLINKLNLFLKNISYELMFYVYNDVVFKIYA